MDCGIDRPVKIHVMLHAGAGIRGGLLSHVTLLAAGLMKSGHAVHAVLSPLSGADEAARKCAASGARVTRLSVGGKGDFGGMLRFGRLVRKEKPDIFHAHLSSPVEALPVLLVARQTGARHLVTTEHAPTWHPLERAWSRAGKRAVGWSLGAVIALCRSDAEYLSARFGIARDQIDVIPNGVANPAVTISREEARAALGLPAGRQNDFIVGFVGALEPKKGVQDLVEAAARQDAGLTLALAGEGSLLAELREKSASLPCGTSIPGHVDEIGRFLAALDLFVLPSHQEAMPLALLEAMAAGLPIVATRVGGIPEALEDGEAGLLVEPGRPDDLAAAIAKVRGDRPLRERLARRAAERAATHYTVPRMVAQVAALYTRLLGAAGNHEAGGETR